MHSISWLTLLASAGVALVVTLLVEYLAKPWLEARKDRILDNNRGKRKAIKGVARSAYLAGRLVPYKNDPNVASKLADDMDAITKDLRECVILAYEVIDVPESVEQQWIEAVTAINIFALASHTGQPTERVWERFFAAAQRLEDLGALLRTSKWHYRRRRRLVLKIKSSSMPSREIYAGKESKSSRRLGEAICYLLRFSCFASAG